MNSAEKRIEKLKLDKQKIEENITKLKKRSAKLSEQIESLENEKIVTAFRSSGFSIDDVITTISIMKDNNVQNKEEEERQ